MTLEIRVLRGHNLAKRDLLFLGKSDPYVVVNVAGQQWRTTMMKSNSNPVWNQGHTFYNVPPNAVIQFDCMDDDGGGAKDDIIGQASVPVAQIQMPNQDLPLTLVYKNKPAGQLQVQASYSGGGHHAVPVSRAVPAAHYDAYSCPPAAPVMMAPTMSAPVPAPAPAVYNAPSAQVITDTVYVEDDRDRELRSKLAHYKERWERELLRDRDELQHLLREEQRLDRILHERERRLRAREQALTRQERMYAHRARHHGHHREKRIEVKEYDEVRDARGGVRRIPVASRTEYVHDDSGDDMHHSPHHVHEAYHGSRLGRHGPHGNAFAGAGFHDSHHHPAGGALVRGSRRGRVGGAGGGYITRPRWYDSDDELHGPRHGHRKHGGFVPAGRRPAGSLVRADRDPLW